MAFKDFVVVLAFFGTTHFLHASTAKSKPDLCWTKWVNRHKANEGTDLEIFTKLAALENNICFRPYAIDYARTDGKPVNEKLDCSFFGCICKDSEQEPGVFCSDYKIRFLCPCNRNEDKFIYSNDLLMCADDESPQTLRCPSNAVIHINSAYYGNIWFSRCGLGSLSSTCRQESSETFQKYSRLCNRKSVCEIEPSPSDIDDRLCKGTKKNLHIDFSCEAVARGPGNYIGSPGEIYIDPSCKYKCTFLMSNRALCVPVCPIYYGFACAPGSIVRWTRKPDKYVKQCKCREPVCIQPEKSCKVHSKIYPMGAVFELGCEEECICLGYNNIKCVPLCQFGSQQCQDGHNQVKTVTRKVNRYPHCKCSVVQCKKTA